jgi:hypothetical protein
MSVRTLQDFEPAEPRGFAHRPFSNAKRRPPNTRKPNSKRKEYASRYKKLYQKIRKIPEYSSFEEWLEHLTGPEAPQIRQHAMQYRRVHSMPTTVSLSTVALITAYILSKMTDTAADDGVNAMTEMCQEVKGIACAPTPTETTRDARPSFKTVVTPPSRNPKRHGSDKRRSKRAKRKERLQKTLISLSTTRETRLPAMGLELWTEGKWLQYMAGTLASDDAYFEKEMETVKFVLSEVYDLVDGPLDGAGDGIVKRSYMEPILSPVVYDLAVNALRTDWAFVNASFHKNIYEDRISSQMQLQRANKIVARLAEEADIDIARSKVVGRLIQNVDNNPEKWYNKKVTALAGTNMVQFLRSTTKSYVRKALQRIPEEDTYGANDQAIKEALHVSAVIDASLSGKAIQQRVSETKPVGELEGALHSVNPTSLQIVRHYRRFLKEQQTNSRKDAINDLLVKTMDNNDKLVRDVRLLWSIYDEESENAFRDHERERYKGIAEQFLGKILRPYRESAAENRGRNEGMEYMNKLLHEWGDWLSNLFTKLLVGILVVVVGVGKTGCPKCRRTSNSSKKTASNTKKAPSKAEVNNDIVKNVKVYRIGHSRLFWIKEGTIYRRIGDTRKQGRPTTGYYRMNQTRSETRLPTPARLVGSIDANGDYQS